ncbi:TetR family transcriptional regulator [Microbispora sp. NBRC 16548]|uniref:TetR/AcrR family transcriptional regulator n=1 Tax=Microbispora sp. NBRC 16548 TaxID=3030994 RepID=UPI001616CBF7|nr:TetR family transcriptional regulator [Microbispora sp. NBRC 16548]GLX03460.1 putative TetR family regulatory protein [Microbispora sp. NBRC 16548]
MATGNAEATKARILEAARDEFSAHGIAGARVDRIAKAAGCNKNLLYIYFHSKETLFATVLEQNLRRVYDELPFTPDDLPGYAARVFDFAMAQPGLMRLMAWAGLEQETGEVALRNAAQSAKVSAMEAAARDADGPGARFAPEFLLTAILALATAWSAASPFGPRLSPGLAADPATLRTQIADAVAAIAAARTGP